MDRQLNRFIDFLRSSRKSYPVLDFDTVSAIYRTWAVMEGSPVEDLDEAKIVEIVDLFDSISQESLDDEYGDDEEDSVSLPGSSVRPQKSFRKGKPAKSFPLREWRFSGVLRQYQAEVLDRIEEPTAPKEGNSYRSLHIVAPPGSGKTVLGLTLAARNGRKALILSPTIVIKDQWVREAKGFVGAEPKISSDSSSLADLNIFTYQMLSVVNSDNPFMDAGLEMWIDELIESGSYSRESAVEWLKNLSETNLSVYRKSVRSRASKVRKNQKSLENVEIMEKILHYNAIDLANRLADAGVQTVVLDESHHLLDHWALVVHYLLKRIAETGGDPLLIGLTATYPSFDGDESYYNYVSLLGDVDYEVPTPAVIKSGNLAPYKNFVWFCEPTSEERKFIKNHGKEVSSLIAKLFYTEDGYAWLIKQLVSEDVNPHDIKKAVNEKYSSLKSEKELYHIDRISNMLAEIPEKTVLEAGKEVIHAELLRASPPTKSLTTVDYLLLLSFYALDEILPNPNLKDLWARIREMLQDYGYYLTDKGVRQGRNPSESVLANSLSKDSSTIEILHMEERANPAGRIKAVVVTDFAVHGNSKGLSGGLPAGGALRTYHSLVSDRTVRDMNPVLVTSKHFRVLEENAEKLRESIIDSLMLPSDVLQFEAVEGMPGIVEMNLTGVGSGATILKALRGLVASEDVRLIVGTRGLLGEGWDNPHMNTLIDLTTTATSSSVQQLRGRTLRLDPSWERKLAHNWAVACVMNIEENPAGAAEIGRLSRKHEHILAVSADMKNETITEGIQTALTGKQQVQLEAYLTVNAGFLDRVDNRLERINRGTVEQFVPRDISYDRWRIGEKYHNVNRTVTEVSDSEITRKFFGGYTILYVLGALLFQVASVGMLSFIQLSRGGNPNLMQSSAMSAFVIFGTLGFTLWFTVPLAIKMLRSLAKPLDYYSHLSKTLIKTLQQMGAIDEGVSSSNVYIQHEEGQVYVSLVNVSEADSNVFSRCLTDMLSGSTALNPRFLIEVGGSTFFNVADDEKVRQANKTNFIARLLSIFNKKPHYVPVPPLIARRRENAIFLFREWRKYNPYMMLREIRRDSDRSHIANYMRQSERREKAIPVMGSGTARTLRVWE